MVKGDFDDILNILKLGRWNFLYFLNLGLCEFMSPCLALAGSFIAPTMDFQCDIQGTNQNNMTTDLNKCTYSIYENTTTGEEIEVQKQCTSWTYDQTDFSDTLTTEYNLVCDQSYLRPTYQTAFMVGSFIGSPINGFLADRFGRKMLMCFTSVIAILSILISTVVPSFTYLLVCRFMTGITISPLFQTGYILCMEVCVPKYRSSIGIFLALPWAFGTMWWGFLGYMIRDWRWLMRATTAPGIFILIFLCFMDESPRWLIVRGHHERALKIIKKAARWNSCKLISTDEELLEQMAVIQEFSRNEKAPSEKKKDSFSITQKMKQGADKVFILYKTPELRKRTLLMYIVFLVSSTVFYGLSLNAGNFQLNPYLYMVVGGLTEIPAYTLTIPIITKFGRVRPTAVSYFVCGATILILAFLPPDPKWVVISLAMAGKLCISAASQIVYLVSTEVFPTEVRMQGVGTSCFISTIGGFTSPFITDIVGNIYRWLPALIFGSLSILAGIAAIFIPETTDKHLPETVHQLERETKLEKQRKKNKEAEPLNEIT